MKAEWTIQKGTWGYLPKDVKELEKKFSMGQVTGLEMLNALNNMYKVTLSTYTRLEDDNREYYSHHFEIGNNVALVWNTRLLAK